MNQKIKFQKDLKAKLGVTMTPNMGVKEILSAFNRLSSPALNNLPSNIQSIVTTAKIALQTAETARTAYATAKKTYVTCQAAIETAAAVTAGQLQQPALKAGAMIAKVAEVEQDDIIYGLGNKLLDSLS